MGLMATVFSLIIEGRIPGTFVWKDDRCVAFMTINPIADGHVLVVPRDEIDHWVDCSSELSRHLFDVAYEIGKAQMNAFACERVGLIIAGYEVPHTHLHVIPTSSMADLSFANAASSVERSDLEAAAEKIRGALRAAGRREVAE
ncbi:MAG: HIT family protein [Actinomycetota bacterium]